jgi:hypothetical protein
VESVKITVGVLGLSILRVFRGHFDHFRGRFDHFIGRFDHFIGRFDRVLVFSLHMNVPHLSIVFAA